MGEISTPPSPYLVKKPTPKSSILFPVPTTIPLLEPAMEYRAVILSLALVLAKASLSTPLSLSSELIESKVPVRSIMWLSTFSQFEDSHPMC